jgi:GH24 family phage-related lysozyme (muramidase)
MRYKEFKEDFGDDGWDKLIGQSMSSMLSPSNLMKYFGNSSGGAGAAQPANKAKTQPSSGSNQKAQPSFGKNTGSTGSVPISSGSGKPSEQLIQFVKKNEGFKAKAFWDYKQWTNGYGTKASSRNEVIDEREADRRLRQKAQEFYDIVVGFDQAHKYGFNDSQRDALTSFVFNGGPGWLNQVSNNGRRSKEQIAKAMIEYNTAGGKRLGGLARRRREEVAMFNTGSNNMPSSNIA